MQFVNLRGIHAFHTAFFVFPGPGQIPKPGMKWTHQLPCKLAFVLFLLGQIANLDSLMHNLLPRLKAMGSIGKGRLGAAFREGCADSVFGVPGLLGIPPGLFPGQHRFEHPLAQSGHSGGLFGGDRVVALPTRSIAGSTRSITGRAHFSH